MRLGQLARSLNTTTTAIVKYLSEKQLKVTDHPNVKLSEEVEQEVIRAFTKAAHPEVQEESAPAQPDNPETKPKVEKQPEPDAVPDKKTNQTEETLDKEASPLVELEEIEVIKAPKIELQGLKVIGKIDLPEPKTRENPEAQIKEKSEKQSKERKGHKKRELSEAEKEKRRLKRKQAQLKRQQQEQAKRKEQEQKERKKQKREYYLRKINKPAATPKKAKSKVAGQAKEPARKRPKSLLSRFWQWLNT